MSKLEQKKKDIEKLQEKEKALNAHFQNSLGDNNKFADYLTKVFKKKIKRSKKKATEGDGKFHVNPRSRGYKSKEEGKDHPGLSIT